MIATIGKVLFVCSIFFSWTIASDFNIAILRPNEPVQQITYKDESELTAGLVKITKDWKSTLVSPAYASVIFTSQVKFGRIMAYEDKTGLYKRLADAPPKVDTKQSKTVTLFLIIECPINNSAFQVKLCDIIKQYDQHVIYVPLEASIFEQLRRPVNTAAKNIRTEFRKCLYDFGRTETDVKNDELVHVTSFTTPTDKIQGSYKNDCGLLNSLIGQFRTMVERDGLGAYIRNTRTFVMVFSMKEYNALDQSKKIDGKEGALIEAHKQFCREQGVIASDVRFVFLAFPGNANDRNLILEDIYDAAWCNKDSSGLISVIYYGDGEGEVDERPAAEFIMLKMHNLIRTATENEPL